MQTAVFGFGFKHSNVRIFIPPTWSTKSNNRVCWFTVHTYSELYLYKEKLKAHFAECSSLRNWFFKNNLIIHYNDHLTENVKTTGLFYFSMSSYLFLWLYCTIGKNVTLWMAKSLFSDVQYKVSRYVHMNTHSKWKAKSLLISWLRNPFCTDFFALTDTWVKRHSITANMNQLYFLAFCKDVLPLGCLW